jgi:ammonia channel protein AmtB
VKIDTGSTAWMLASTALVLLMTPGLAFFYGGMTRAKSTLNMMMMSWVAIITVSIAWVLYGDSLSFAKGNGFIGGFAYLGEHGLVGSDTRVNGIPDLLFSAFQLTFAVITVALISGAIADRTKFGAWALFTVLWATLVYFPVAHWVWGGGWLSSLGLLAGAVCCCAIGLKHKLGFDDSLDVVGVHLVGGAFGAISLGFLAAYPLLDGQRKGLFYGGGIHQLGVQVLGPVAVGLYSFAVAWILGKIIDKTMGFRIPEEDEVTGIDLAEHAETAYEFGGIPPVHGVSATLTGPDKADKEVSAGTH